MTIKEALDEKTRICEICKEQGKPTEAACNNCTDNTAISAFKKLIDITEILDDTDYTQPESYNEAGEDKGYFESICAISIAVDGKWRWL